MSVVLGTDFSEGAQQAARVAIGWARRMGEDLLVATAVEKLPPATALGGAPYAELQAAEEQAARRSLAEVAGRLEGQGVRVQTRLLEGAPASALAKVAREVGAPLIVVGSHQRGALGRFLLGSTADRILREADRPILVVRGRADALEAWATSGRPLPVLLPLAFDRCSLRALELMRTLRGLGPCDVTIAHLYAVPITYDRLGFRDRERLGSAQLETSAVLERDLRAMVGTLPGEGPVRFLVRPCWGRPGLPLRQLAEEVRPELIVTGTHARRGLAHLLHGSVAQDLVHHQGASLLCVPPCEEEVRPEPLPELGRILAVEDADDPGLEAVRWAAALVQNGGGALEIASVLRPGEDPEARRRRLDQRLASLLLEDGQPQRFHLLESVDRRAAVLQASLRLGVDLLVLPSFYGPLNLEEVEQAGRPVLVVPPRPA